MQQSASPRPKPVVLLILDGWGHREEVEDNALAQAELPNWRRLLATCPHTLVHTEGRHVGLPDGQMGNSEVGHMNLGAGRIVYQDLTRIDAAIEDGSFFANEELRAACAAAREGGRTLKALLGRIDGDARRLAEAPDAALAQIGGALVAAARALEEAADWLLTHDTQPAHCAAGAVPLLRLAGTVIGGWLSARMAEAATAQLAAGAGDAGFLGTKRATASHYAAHVLVQAPMLRDIVTGGAASTLALADDQL